MLRDFSTLALRWTLRDHVTEACSEAPIRSGLSRYGEPAAAGDTQPHLAYRRDIDGLRAVAVSAVLGYHLQISWLSGGFVGVDIFFVISGYLIGALILNGVKRDTFSLVNFYSRRVRRIVPAFIAMILPTLILSYFLLLPTEYVRLAWSALSATLSASNIYFWQHTGYFDAPASSQILLHTWSLGVEEQFYLFFPVFVLVLARKIPRMLTTGLVVAWVGSFLLSAYGVVADPQAAFFLAPARAWELLSGTLLASQPRAVRLGPLGRNLLATFGLAMIGFAITAFTAETPFPGPAALLPCLGTAMIIAAGQSGGSLVARVLSLRPVVFVGLISYSLYLWHWPIIFFQRSDAVVLSNTSRLVVLISSFAIATASWQFIEKPFRVRFKSVQGPWVLAGGLFTLAAVALVTVFIVAGRGLPERFSPIARAYADYLDYGQAHFREGSCFIDSPYTFSNFDRAKCLRAANNRKNYLLIGDSHAAQLWFGLSTLITDVNIQQATAAGCSPDPSEAWRASKSCGHLMTYIYTDYLATHRIDRLLVAARWFERDLPGVEHLLGWAKTRSIPVTLFGPMVEYDAALPRLLANAAQNNDMASVTYHQSQRKTELDLTLQKLATSFGDQYVSFYSLLCRFDNCQDLAPDGSPMEFDTNHLTRQGSLVVAQKLIDTGLLK